MPVTSTNYTSIHYVPEATPGTTPASPAFKELPTTGGAPSGNLTTAVSEAIRRDRMTDDLIVVDSEVGGDINYELSYLPYKPLLKALLQDDTAPNVVNFVGSSNITFLAQATSNVTTTGNFTTEGVVTGMNIRVVNTTNNNGIFKVVEKVSDTALTVTPQPVAEATTSATITADMVRNGVGTPETFTLLKLVEGITAPAYFYYAGCIISAMSFNFTTGSILNGTISVVGRTETVTETEIGSSSYTAPPAYTIMNSVQSLSNVTITGISADTCFSSLNLNINNNVNAAKCIGTLGAHDLASFTLDVTSDIELYFEDIVTYNLYKNSSFFSLSFHLTDGDGNVMVVTLPACKFETLDTPIDGKDNFYMLTGSMRSLRDTTTECMVQFDFLDV